MQRAVVQPPAGTFAASKPVLRFSTPEAMKRSGLKRGGSGPSRRAFCRGAAALLVARGELLRVAKPPVAPAPAPSEANGTYRVDVAAVDHDRILAAAERALAEKPTPVTALPCPRSPGSVNDYYSEVARDPNSADEDEDARDKKPAAAPVFTAHRDALFALGLNVPALAAAYTLTGEDRYAQHAAEHLRAWFADPATRMTPNLNLAQVVPSAQGEQEPEVKTNSGFGERSAPLVLGHYQGLVEAVPLVEIAQAIPFLATSSALSDTDRKALQMWFAAYLQWLTDPDDAASRLPGLARDAKNHHATSWLLQAAACANLAVPQGDVAKAEDTMLANLRHRFKSVTIRSQINFEGTFRNELGSATPYRDSLFNLDMLAGVCQLLSTRFDSLWQYQMEEGAGMRAAVAYHFQYIADRGTWPFRADASHFNELPGRRNCLLFAAYAYQRPEYAAEWKRLSPDVPTPDVQRTVPIQQPLLWMRQPRPAASS